MQRRHHLQHHEAFDLEARPWYVPVRYPRAPHADFPWKSLRSLQEVKNASPGRRAREHGWLKETHSLESRECQAGLTWQRIVASLNLETESLDDCGEHYHSQPSRSGNFRI